MLKEFYNGRHFDISKISERFYYKKRFREKWGTAIQVDVIGTLSVTEQVNRYVLVAMD